MVYEAVLNYNQLNCIVRWWCAYYVIQNHLWAKISAPETLWVWIPLIAMCQRTWKKYFWNTYAKSMISFLGNVMNQAIILQFIHWLFTFLVRKGWLLTKQTWHHKNVSEKTQNNVLEIISSIFLLSFGDKWLRKREFFKISCHLYFTMLFNGTVHIALDWTAL